MQHVPWLYLDGKKYEEAISDEHPLKLGLSGFEILPLIAFKLRWFLCFKIAASTGSKRFKLKPFVFLGKFLLVMVSKFVTILLK